MCLTKVCAGFNYLFVHTRIYMMIRASLWLAQASSLSVTYLLHWSFHYSANVTDVLWRFSTIKLLSQYYNEMSAAIFQISLLLLIFDTHSTKKKKIAHPCAVLLSILSLIVIIIDLHFTLSLLNYDFRSTTDQNVPLNCFIVPRRRLLCT